MVVAERELLQRQRHDLTGEAAEEEKYEGRYAEEKEPTPGGGTVGREGQLHEETEQVLRKHAHNVTPEMLVPSMKLLQRGASSLLRYLVAVSMRQAPLARSVDGRSEEVGLQASRDEAACPSDEARPVARGAPEQSSPKADNGAAAAALPPTRERSMYGTPLVQMRKHVDNLHQVRSWTCSRLSKTFDLPPWIFPLCMRYSKQAPGALTPSLPRHKCVGRLNS